MKAILYTNGDGRKVPMSVTDDGRARDPETGEFTETETDYLARMIDVFVPAEFRASAQVVDKATADAEAEKPTVEDVKRERERRLALGFDHDFGDDRGVHRIGTTAADMQGWDEVTSYASALLAVNDTTTLIDIATDTGAAQVTAQEWQSILLAAAAYRQPIWGASFVLQGLCLTSTFTGDVTAWDGWPTSS